MIDTEIKNEAEMTEKRRYTNHIEPSSEHDLLLTLHTKFNHMYKMQETNADKLTAFIEKIDIRCENRSANCSKAFESKISSNTFWKVFGVIVIVLIGVCGTITFNSVNSAKNTVLIMAIDGKKK